MDVLLPPGVSSLEREKLSCFNMTNPSAASSRPPVNRGRLPTFGFPTTLGVRFFANGRLSHDRRS